MMRDTARRTDYRRKQYKLPQIHPRGISYVPKVLKDERISYKIQNDLLVYEKSDPNTKEIFS